MAISNSEVFLYLTTQCSGATDVVNIVMEYIWPVRILVLVNILSLIVNMS